MEISGNMSLQTLKKDIIKAAERMAPEAITVSDRIWEYAEEPLKEFKSSRLMRDVAARHGFVVEREFSNMPTAFAMAAGSGRPRIGILSEYDALPDCGLEKGTWGHGCAHNLLGGGSLLAALIAQKIMKDRGLRGTLILFGCPAEETVIGKVYMARDGAFANLDAVLGWHPGVHNTVNPGGSALNTYAFEFFGRTAHAAGAQSGRSALDGAELMDHAVNILREHIPENVRIHSVITCGGGAPNVVPEYARSWYYVRGKDRKEVGEIAARVIKCAKGAATATETKMKPTLLTAVYERLPNDASAEHLHLCLKKMGPTPFNKSDERALKRLKLKGKLSREIKDIRKERGRASTDEDNVSWLVPLGNLGVATHPDKLIGHHRDTTRVGKSPFAHKGMVHAGKTLALAALSLATDSKLRAKIKREFRRRTKDFTYDPIVPKRQRPPVRDTIPHAPPAPQD